MKKCSLCIFFRDMSDVKIGCVCDKKVKESDYKDWGKINPDDQPCSDFELKRNFNPFDRSDDGTDDGRDEDE